MWLMVNSLPAEVGVFKTSDGVKVGVVRVFARFEESLLPVDVFVVPVEVLNHATRVNLKGGDKH